MPTETERLATLEAVVTGDLGLVKKVDEIHTDVKTLLAAHNKGRGMATVGNLLLNAAAAVAGVVAGIHWGKP